MRAGRWLVYSDMEAAAPYFCAQGFDVFNSPKYVPDLGAMHRFDPEGKYVKIYNRSSYLQVSPLPAGAAVEFRLRSTFVVEAGISPTDPVLRELGIRYEAFASRPDEKVAPPGAL